MTAHGRKAAGRRLAGCSSYLAVLCIVYPVFVGSLFATQAQAVVPRAEKVVKAIAGANRSGRRIRAVKFDVSMRIGDGQSVAVGELVSHPTGLARLELRASGGLVERHILMGNSHSAARNTRLLVRPRAFLPPLFVMQSSSTTILGAALQTLGVDRTTIGLAPCGELDCYVLGDPTRAVARPNMKVAKKTLAVEQPPATAAASDAAEEPQGEAALQQGAPEYFSSLWVDTVDHSVRQLQSATGVKVVLGPYVSFERLSVPKWWTIEEPGKRIVRFEVEGAVEVNAPAAAFSKTWLMAPVVEAGEQGEPDTQAPAAPAAP